MLTQTGLLSISNHLSVDTPNRLSADTDLTTICFMFPTDTDLTCSASILLCSQVASSLSRESGYLNILEYLESILD